jgi:ribosomal protein S18 acetylase RimI-like enzyme
MSMQIRPAHIADVRQIAEVSISSWRSAYAGIMPDAVLDRLSVAEIERSWAERFDIAGLWAFVAEERGQIRGWIKCGKCRDADADTAGEVYGLYIDPACVRRGIGRLLWQAAGRMLAEHGYGCVVVWVLKANYAGRQFYEAVGGRLDQNVEGVSEQKGTSLPKVRYWCPVPPAEPGQKP